MVQTGAPQRVLRVIQSADPGVPPPALDSPPLACAKPPPPLSECGLRTAELDAPPER